MTTPVRVDLGAIGIKECSTVPKDPASLDFSPLDCLVSYPENSLGESYSSAEMQPVYSTVPLTKSLKKKAGNS